MFWKKVDACNLRHLQVLNNQSCKLFSPSINLNTIAKNRLHFGLIKHV
jgi:hypothetical protein